MIHQCKLRDNPLALLFGAVSYDTFYLYLSMRRFKMFIALGDILVSINDRLVVDETFEEISTILDMLM